MGLFGKENKNAENTGRKGRGEAQRAQRILFFFFKSSFSRILRSTQNSMNIFKQTLRPPMFANSQNSSLIKS